MQLTSLPHEEQLKSIQGVLDNQKPTLVSLFAGCGGLDLPFHLAGFDTLWANDFDSHACKTYAQNISKNIHEGPIEDYDLSKLPYSDVVVGGFPCQDFSVIWKRPGINGKRGNLYTYFVEVVNQIKPKVFIAENVKGLLSANNYVAIKKIISDFENVISPGYLVKPKLYNFAEYGVPQFRERVLIVGIRKDLGFDFIHPKAQYGPNNVFPYYTAGEALSNVEKVVANNETLNVKNRTIEILKKIGPGGNFTDIPPDDEHYVKGMISHVYRRIDPNKPSTTIIANGGGGTWGYHYPEPRPLTNRERARLQTFPDSFIFEGSITEVRKQIGNAVPPAGLVGVIQNLLPLFKEDYEKNDLFEIAARLEALSIKQRLSFTMEESALQMSMFGTTPYENIYE